MGIEFEMSSNTMTQKQSKADEIRAEVIKLVAEITERAPEEIADTALFIEDLGIDSLMAIEMLVAVDKKYRIQVPEEEFAAIKNVNDAVALVERHVAVVVFVVATLGQRRAIAERGHDQIVGITARLRTPRPPPHRRSRS